MWRALRYLVPALCGGAVAVFAPCAPAEAISAAQRDSILTFGPWPQDSVPDPGNRVSGKPLAIELGRLLFRDPRMSPLGYIGCVTCHQPDRGFTDGKARAHGVADLPRNTPALANLRLQRRYGWDGASSSLWQAAIRPIVDAREIGASPANVRAMFVREPGLAACYRAVFGVSALSQPPRTVVNVGKALAAYVETLVTGRTPFDALRDALAAGDEAKAAVYPAAAWRGLLLFVGDAGCAACHRGPNFSDGALHAGAAPRSLIRTPSLRNVAVTAPYLHDGSAATLHEAVLHAPRTVPLAPPQVDDLVAFLGSLTDATGARRPWVPTEVDTRCR